MDNSLEMAKILLENDADPSVIGQQTPVSFAVKLNNKEMLSLLLDYDAPPTPLMDSALPPLIMALKQENEGCVYELVKKGVNPNTVQVSKHKKKEINSLSLAIDTEQYRPAILLLLCGCDVDKSLIEEKILPKKFLYKEIKDDEIPFNEELESLITEKDGIKDEFMKIHDQLLPSTDMNRLIFGPSINVARGGYNLLIPFVEKLIDFTGQLTKKRLRRLEQQTDYYYRYIAGKTAESYDYNKYIPEDNKEYVEKNRLELHKLAMTLGKFNKLLVDTYNLIKYLQKETKSYIDYAFIVLNAAEGRIQNISTKPNILLRAGIPKDVMKDLNKDIPAKVDVLRETRGQLVDFMDQCSLLENELLKSTRQCYK